MKIFFGKINFDIYGCFYFITVRIKNLWNSEQSFRLKF